MNPIEEEIEALEREAADPITNPETRYVNQVKATLLRNGYRIQEQQNDHRILLIVHIASQTVVERITTKMLHFSRMSTQGWVNMAQGSYAKAAMDTPIMRSPFGEQLERETKY